MTTPTELQIFTFEDTSVPGSLPISTVTWTMGDGNSVTNMTEFKYIYATPNTYDVTLTVTDSAGNTSSQTQSVDVTGNTSGVIIVQSSITLNPN